MRVLRIAQGLSFLLLYAATAIAQSNDRHITSDQAHDLYQRSAYAHGYIHGYETGFHNADMDVHMGRGERSPNAIKDFRDSNDGYQHEFGDKQYFRLGYKQGFKEGYSDSIRSRTFRAINETTKIASGFHNADDPRQNQGFDRAFVAGYQSGHESGSTSTRGLEFDHAASVCQAQAPRESKSPDSYCDAFMRGFTLGFADGETNKLDRGTQTAKK